MQVAKGEVPYWDGSGQSDSDSDEIEDQHLVACQPQEEPIHPWSDQGDGIIL